MVACTRTEFRGNVLECADSNTNNNIISEVSMDSKLWAQLDTVSLHRRIEQLEASQVLIKAALRGNLVLMALLLVLLVVLPVLVGTNIN